MHGEADRLDAGQLGGEAIGVQHLVMKDAEFVFFAAGRDVAVGACVDIRVDSDRHPRRAALRRRERAQLAQFGERLDVDLVDAGGERRRQLGAGLADA